MPADMIVSLEHTKVDFVHDVSYCDPFKHCAWVTFKISLLPNALQTPSSSIKMLSGLLSGVLTAVGVFAVGLGVVWAH